jgi:hypothetical protein
MLAKLHYEFCIHKALEINPILVELGWVQREMHLMVRHHLCIFHTALSPLPLNICFFKEKLCTKNKTRSLMLSIVKSFAMAARQLSNGKSKFSILYF